MGTKSLFPKSIRRAPKQFALGGALLLALLASGGASARAASPAFPALAAVRDGSHGPWFRGACAAVAQTDASCGAQVISNAAGDPLASPIPPSGSYGPAAFHTGYNLPTTTQNAETIGIVDAYDDPNIEADLAVYDANYGLPACTTANGCFQRVDQSGGTNYPSSTSTQAMSWALETSLDVETAHEICQNCKVLLVEANSSNLSDLAASVDEAVSLGATVVSNSYGGSEFAGETSFDSHYNHPGVPIIVSAGDSPYDPASVDYPAASQYVTAVGGTRLVLNSNLSYGSESVWLTGPTEGTGSGCSRFEPKPSWQTDTGCAKRMIADVSADADPATGAAIVDSDGASGANVWFQVGGTSLASPLVAGVYALSGSTQGGSYAHTPYLNASSLHDITSGNNGTCTPAYFCTAGAGYDGPTGVGSPNGVGGFTAPGFTLGVSAASPIFTGATGSYAVSVNDLAGFSNSVALIASGLPAGVSAAFGPSSTAARSTLTLTVAAPAMAGSYPFTISGTSGSVVASVPATVVVVTPPGAPTGVSAVAASSSATVSWTAPLATGGSPITGYTVTASPGGSTASAGPGATTATLNGLLAGTAYTFTVTASNAAGASAASAPSNPVTPPGLPGAPTLVSAVGTDKSATVSWAAPASNGGSALTGYTIVVSPGGATSSAAAGATSATITGLVNGTAYTFTVTATNAIGTGPSSLPSSPIVPAGAPGAPTGVSAVAADGTATVSWSTPTTIGGGPITGYTVTASPGGTTATASAGATTLTIAGLTDGTSYTFSVSAANATGSGSASAPSNAVTPTAPASTGGSSGGSSSSSSSSGGSSSSGTSSSGTSSSGTSSSGSGSSGASSSGSTGGSGGGGGSSSSSGSGSTPTTTTVAAALPVTASAFPVPVLVPAIPTPAKPAVAAVSKHAPAAAAKKGVTRIGTAGPDILHGTSGNDVLKGGAGNDILYGGAGNDKLYGGPGNDVIWAGSGHDIISGGHGNDTIHAADGNHDTIDCGSGHDVVYANTSDKVAKDCEVVYR